MLKGVKKVAIELSIKRKLVILTCAPIGSSGYLVPSGTRCSMDFDFSKSFSILTNNVMPSTTPCISSTSERPKRSKLDTSKMPLVEAVSTPPKIKRKEWVELQLNHGTKKVALLELFYGFNRGINLYEKSYFVYIFYISFGGKRNSAYKVKGSFCTTDDLPVPRFCSLICVSMESKRASLLNKGSLMWTPALIPVPRFEGHVKMYPKCSFHMNSLPSLLIKFSVCCCCEKGRDLEIFEIYPLSGPHEL